MTNDLIARLRDLQQSWAESVQRLDSGEHGGGIMTTIRAEQHDIFKRAAEAIESQQAEIERLAMEARVAAATLAAEMAANATLADQIERLRKDAERYRFARLGAMTAMCIEATGEIINAEHRYREHELAQGWPEKIDAAIDSAMQAQKEKP